MGRITPLESVQLPLHIYPSLLRQGVRIACTTTRQGGVSKDSYATLNLGYSGGDNPSLVTKNRELLCQAVGIAPNQLFLPYQTHGTIIRLIDSSFLQADRSAQEILLQGVDALITRQSDICIGVTTADCVPILLYDPVNRAVAAIHAGWRASQQRIASKTIAAMQAQFETDPHQLCGIIGPSIGPCCYEVGEEVVAAFQQAGYPEHLAQPMPDSSRYRLDLWEANRLDLLRAGMRNEAIETSYLCTYEMCHDFFSARRLGNCSGRFATLIGI